MEEGKFASLIVGGVPLNFCSMEPMPGRVKAGGFTPVSAFLPWGDRAAAERGVLSPLPLAITQGFWVLRGLSCIICEWLIEGLGKSGNSLNNTTWAWRKLPQFHLSQSAKSRIDYKKMYMDHICR